MGPLGFTAGRRGLIYRGTAGLSGIHPRSQISIMSAAMRRYSTPPPLPLLHSLCLSLFLSALFPPRLFASSPCTPSLYFPSHPPRYLPPALPLHFCRVLPFSTLSLHSSRCSFLFVLLLFSFFYFRFFHFAKHLVVLLRSALEPSTILVTIATDSFRYPSVDTRGSNTPMIK